MNRKKSAWTSVKEIMGDRQISFGSYLSYEFTNTPRRILYSISYYKFAAKMIGRNKRVLDVGCGEGLGTWLLAVECGQAKGIDIDCDAIEIGKRNWKDPKISFECADFLSIKEEGEYDAVVSFDVIEHILPKNVPLFFHKIVTSLTHYGIAVIGTPNITSQQYASPVTKAGHVNVYSWERLEYEMKQHFVHVFMFGANDEVVHTGFLPMAHYLIGLGCRKK